MKKIAALRALTVAVMGLATASVAQMTSHTLRHYFISNAVMSGVDLLTIAKWDGNSSTKMIEETYGHLSPEYRARQMLKVNVGTVSVPSSA